MMDAIVCFMVYAVGVEAIRVGSPRLAPWPPRLSLCE
jgi:hypothetical protein